MNIKKISCGGFKIDNQTIVEEDGILKAIGGGGSVLVAHATVNGADLMSIDPENPLTITIDKTLMELKDAEYSLIHVNVIFDGGTTLSLEFPRMAWAGGQLVFGGSELIGALLDTYNLVISVILSDDDTVAMLMAVSEINDGGTMIAHATSESYPTAGGDPVALTLDESYSDLADAGYSVMEYTYDGEVTYLPLINKNPMGLFYGAVITGDSLIATVTSEGSTISLSS